MKIDMKQMEWRMRESICPKCVRFTQNHTCSLPPGRDCSLFGNLEAVVGIVARTHSERIDPYVDVLRKQVCAACHSEDDHACCPLRDGLDCGLNLYYPIIVDEIERELKRQSKAIVDQGSLRHFD
jgi:hypothetical protein